MTVRRMRMTRILKSIPLLICLLVLCLIAYFTLESYSTEQVNIRKTQQTDEEQDFSNLEKDLTDSKMESNDGSKAARKNLIVVSHGRSGSTLMGDIFNHHPSVFYMYEPLQSVERVHTNLKPGSDYNDLAKEFLSGIFQCKFDSPELLADIEHFYRKPDHPRVSKAIASPPLCPYSTSDERWDQHLCPAMTSESLGSTCKEHYEMTVLKVLVNRVPDNNIGSILGACDTMDTNCRIIFLVRDPRAVIASALSVGFFKDNRGDSSRLGTREFSYWTCKETEDNLESIRKLPKSLRNRIKFQRYEDLALDPLKELSALYEFAGLSVLDSVKTWLNETTRQSRSACNHAQDGEQATCTKDDAWLAANRWRWKVHPHEIDVIEHYCRGVMLLMGYRPVHRSHELLANVKIPLFSRNFEARNWF